MVVLLEVVGTIIVALLFVVTVIREVRVFLKNRKCK